jgi:YfiH family protein
VNRALAAVHAGWRGTVSEIGPKTLKRMTETFSTRVDQIEVAIGPSIGVCCYEVGPEVAAKLCSVFPERQDLTGKAKIDLAEANRRQLISFGVRPDAIALVPRCTACDPDDFHSYRRDMESAGRMISAIGIRK